MAATKTVRVNPGTPVVIAGKGIVKATGAPVYGATSASEPGRLHLIVWDPSGHEWACDCARWHFRRHCRHTTALNERLANERVGALTEKGRAALAAYDSERRETAPRRVQAFPTSLLK